MYVNQATKISNKLLHVNISFFLSNVQKNNNYSTALIQIISGDPDTKVLVQAVFVTE